MQPPQELRHLLSHARNAGVDFDDAWEPAMHDALPPSEGRVLWRDAFEATRDQWKRAYSGDDIAGVRALLT